ncbi:MAG: ferritin-like domain-containing protein [Tepidanaerobacteraceae bacterium]
MPNNDKIVKALNELLQGEYMAVESFNNFISRVKNEHIKTGLQSVQKQHRINIEKIASYIQEIGGQPDENLGIKGKMGDIKVNIDLGLKTDDTEIVKKAIEGETKGVNMAEKVLRGKLDDKSREVVGEILQKDRRSIDKLKVLI